MLDPDVAVEQVESLAHRLMNECSEQEQLAIREVAAERLRLWLAEPDADGYTRRKLLTGEQKNFLEAIAEGRFDLDEGDE